MNKINIRIGSAVIECEQGLAISAGYSAPYANDDSQTARGGSEVSYGTGVKLTPDQSVAVALSEGHTGEMAVMRAIAVSRFGAETGESRSARVAAECRQAAAKDELRAEQIRSARLRRAD